MRLLAALLARLGHAPQPAAARSAPQPPAAPRAAAGEPPGGTDRQFTALLLGIPALTAADATAAERRIIERLEALAGEGEDSSLVPRLPAVLPQLISLVRRDEAAPRELAERLERDPALVGEVVRMANSPRYRAGRDVADLQGAVVILGQRGLMQVVTRAAMQPIFSARQGRFSRIGGTRLWDLSDRCAHACACLCGTADSFHAYLAGMVANTGLIVALRVLDADYQEAQAPDSESFHDALADVASRLSECIARHWNFHDEVCRAVLRRRLPAAPGDDVLTRALRAADRASKWHMLAPAPGADAPPDGGEAERRACAELDRAFAR